MLGSLQREGGGLEDDGEVLLLDTAQIANQRLQLVWHVRHGLSQTGATTGFKDSPSNAIHLASGGLIGAARSREYQVLQLVHDHAHQMFSMSPTSIINLSNPGGVEVEKHNFKHFFGTVPRSTP